MGGNMHRFIDETPVGVMATIGGLGFLQSLINWATPTLQFIVLLGSAVLVVWKVWLIYQQIKIRIKNKSKLKKQNKHEK